MNGKPIKGYEGNYYITDTGKVYSAKRKGSDGRYLKTHTNTNGYIVVFLRKNGEKRTKLLHRLVAQAFIPNPDNKPCVNHKDGCKLNNCVDNLEWCTYSENMKHAIREGLNHIPALSGENHPMHKLTQEQVYEVRELFSQGIPRPTIAKRFGVTKEQIYNITNRKHWKISSDEL